MEMFILLINSTLETLLMVFAAGLIAFALGTPLGIILFYTQSKGLFPNNVVFRILNIIVDLTRSIPFIILMIALVPLTRLLMGTSIGTLAAIVPLSFAATPFVARLVENALHEIPYGLIEAGLAMGATPWQITTRILLLEAAAGLISGYTLTLINLVGYSAMTGAVGGGGLGDVAIRYGYQRFDLSLMCATIIILITLVKLIQWYGSLLTKIYRH